MLAMQLRTQRMDLLVPQLIAAAGHLHSFPLNVTVPLRFDAAFRFSPPQSHRQPLSRVPSELSPFDHVLGFFPFPLNVFPFRIFFQIFEKAHGKSEKTATACVRSRSQ